MPVPPPPTSAAHCSEHGVMGVYVTLAAQQPAGQATHAPVLFRCVPVGHEAQPSPGATYCPAGHSAEHWFLRVAPLGDAMPAGQSVGAQLGCALGDHLPAGQMSQRAAPPPPSEKRPGAQFVHEEAPASACAPALQLMHVVWRTVPWCLPAGQSQHVACPTVPGWYLPAGQSLHGATPPAV
jgi:hypothetical protein